MRPESELSNTVSRTSLGGTLLKEVESPGPDAVVKPNSLSLAKNKMSLVFPATASSEGAAAAQGKNMVHKNTMSLPDHLVGRSEQVKTLCDISKPSVTVGEDNSRSSPLLTNNNNNNNICRFQIKRDRELSWKQRGTPGAVSKIIKGEASNGSCDRIVEAIIEQPDFTWGDRSGKIVNCLPAKENGGIMKGGHFASDAKGAMPAVSGTTCSRPLLNSSLKSSVTTATAVERGQLQLSAKSHLSSQSGSRNERGQTTNRSVSFFVSSDQRAADDLQLRDSTNFGQECGKLTSQKPSSHLGPANSDDSIITEMASPSFESETVDRSVSSAENGGEDERTRLPAKLSKGLVGLFQKNSSSSSSRSERNDPENGGQRGRSERKSRPKDNKRKSSFAWRLMASLADWRRKPPSQTKRCASLRNKKDLEDDKTEPYNSTMGKIPIFVSPENQVEIIEDAPAQITEEQKQLLRESWQLIKADVADVGVETFMGLFHTHPDSIDSFLAFKDKTVEDLEQSAVLKAHALRVMQTVDKCITRLDSTDKMASVLCTLGRRHVGYRANASLIPLIGKQFISAIEPKMTDRWSTEAQVAWDALFQNINYHMRRGMMQEKHRIRDEVKTKKKK